MKPVERRLWVGAAVSLLCGGATAVGAVPAPPGGGMMAPPAEAVAACISLGEGASCSFEAPDQTVSGLCTLIESSLACAPEGGPPQPPASGEHDGDDPLGLGDDSFGPDDGPMIPTDGESSGDQPPLEAIAACDAVAVGESCSFPSPQGDLTGSCAVTAGGTACVPADGGAPDSTADPNIDPGVDPAGDPSGNEGHDGLSGGPARYDAATGAVVLPRVDAGALGSFSLALSLAGLDPLSFSLDLSSVRPAEDSEAPASALFDPATGALSIPFVNVGDQWYAAELAQLDGGGFRFGVISLTETSEPPMGPDGVPTGDPAGEPPGDPSDGADDSVVFDPVTTVGVAAGYPIVDTNQRLLYDAAGAVVSGLQPGDEFYGQDGHYAGNAPSYTDNGDGTISDNVTGLMWQKTPDFNGDGVIDADDKKGLSDALADAEGFSLAGYDDWRLPTIKELYSLMDFSGTTGSLPQDEGTAPSDAVPYLDTAYFDFAYGDGDAGERFIDAQYWSSTVYGSTTMGGSDTAFGVNFADGRIKGYPYGGRMEMNGRYVRYVRGGGDYGNNLYSDNGDATINDAATGLMWMRGDSGTFAAGPAGDGAMDWGTALAWCEGLEHAGYSDWRLPNIKELHSIVDYSRAPDITNSAAIDPLFETTLLADGINAGGTPNYPYYWSGTTHVEGPFGDHGAYFAFGEARGYLNGVLDDVHGAGAQRSDPKSGDPSPYAGVGHGPQGDVIGINNHARCVRNIDAL